jgi:hypothetical protein
MQQPGRVWTAQAGLPKHFRSSDSLFDVGRVFISVDCLPFRNGAVVEVEEAVCKILAAGRTKMCL